MTCSATPDETKFRNVFLIYCLQRLPDGCYIALNRAYKPLGVACGDWVDYETAPGRLRFKRKLTALQIAYLSCKGDAGAECIYLYNDACIPTFGVDHWDAYARRLQRLADLTIRPLS